MNFEKKKTILDKIKEYDRIILFRHIRPDGDAVGSTKGLCEILRLTYPEKDVRVINNDFSEYTAFLGGEDSQESDEFYECALGIVLDTATAERISNPKYSLCKELIKIDHHINVHPYGNHEWVEEKRSSTCEMIADFYRTFEGELKINKEAATYLYTGIVTDSGRFKFNSVSGETHRLAGMLLDLGVDIDYVHTHLYIREANTFRFEAYVYENMTVSENGVAYLRITRELQDRFSLSYEDAGEAVTYMESIKDSLIWLVFIDVDDGSTRVRLRSRFVKINSLAEKYHGGGHAHACGATVYGDSEVESLIGDADRLLKEYKENNEGWL